MSTLAQNAAAIVSNYGDIKAAIQNKGVTVASNTPVTQYPTLINSISGDSSGNPWFSGRGWERNVRTDVTLENNAGFYYYPFASNGVSASYPTFTITDQTAWSIDTGGVINDGFPYISTVGTQPKRAYTGIARMDGGHLKEVYARRKSGGTVGGSLRVKVWETS